MIRFISCTFAVIALSVSGLQAQPQGRSEGGPMGQGGGGVSPVMMTCGPDLKQFCDGQRGMAGVRCLMENITDISEPCADALAEASDNMERDHGPSDDN